MVKVGVQTKGILPEMGIEDGVAIIAQAGFEMVDFNLDTFLKVLIFHIVLPLLQF